MRSQQQVAKIIEKLDVSSRNSYEKQNKIIEKKSDRETSTFFYERNIVEPM